MDEYIKREAAYYAFYTDDTLSGYEKAYCREIIKNIPAADVAPVRYGVWEYEPPTINTYGMLKCSKCGWWTLDQSACDVYHYCPNCGCKMDLEE